MAEKRLSRAATAARGALVAYLAPKLAADAKIDLSALLKDVKASTLKARQPEIVSGVVDLTKGKLAKDASIETKDLGKLLDVINVLEPKDDAMDDLDPNAALPASGMRRATDEEPRAKMREFLKGKLSEDDMKACDDMWGNSAMDADETEEEKKAREAKEAAAKDKSAKDAEMDKDKVDKKAMDAAISAAAAATRKTVMDEVRANERAIRKAERDVQPYVGDLAITFDSAEQVYRHTLEMLGVPEAKTIHASALATILQMQPKAGAKPSRTEPKLGMDEAALTDAAKYAPGLSRIVIGA